MTCKGCYKPVKEGYCLRCRKTLFDGLRTSPVLPFDTPKDENLVYFQEHSKRLSISGVQLKYSLRLHHKELVLTEKGGGLYSQTHSSCATVEVYRSGTGE